jgi:hypothetical protein
MQLRAGELTMMYENGFLRYISAGKSEVLQMIYFAVRDSAWDNIPSEITHEQIVQKDNGFTITYRRIFDHGDIRMQWQVQIEGLASSEIHFEIKGQALSSFQKNRAGCCVLHSIKECSGKDLSVTHPDGSTENGAFPLYISPHQPFKDIASMQWQTANGSVARLSFKGDLFEMEDQRNWTDNSFKTYCTPLDIPFPVLMRQGDEVHQSVHFSFSPSPRPAIGIGRSAVRNDANLEKLAAIGFAHYRTDIRLSDSTWQDTLKISLDESQALSSPLEIALFQTDQRQLHHFLDTQLDPTRIKSIILPLDSASLPLLKARFPGVLIGLGTDSHFVDLNRSQLSTEGLDFISYAIHPQVHASDDATLMENAGAQGYTVETARHKYGIPVHISPITLHARPIIDPRLYTDLGARWTAASLKSLAAAGAASITYFDTEIAPYPVAAIFRDLLS